MIRASVAIYLLLLFVAGFAASYPWADGAEKLAHASSSAELRIAGAALSQR